MFGQAPNSQHNYRVALHAFTNSATFTIEKISKEFRDIYFRDLGQNSRNSQKLLLAKEICILGISSIKRKGRLFQI